MPNETAEIQVTPAALNLSMEVDGLATRLEKFVISTDDEYGQAAEFLKVVKGHTNLLDEERRSMTRPLDESKSRIMAWFKPKMEKLSAIEAALKKAQLAYTDAKRRIADEATRIAREKAAKEAEEAQAAMEFERQQAIETGDEASATIIAYQQRDLVRAAAHVEVAPEVPKISGQSVRKVWKARIVDASLVPREYLIPNVPMIDAVAKSTKGTVQIPGVEIYFEEILSSRSK